MTVFYGSIDSVEVPFSLSAGASPTTCARMRDDATCTWQDATVDTWIGGRTLPSAYGGATIDTTATVYLIMAVKGAALPVLVKEADFAAMDTVLAAAGYASPQWTLLARIDGGDLTPQPQV